MIQRALRNLSIAVFISLLTSTVYFLAVLIVIIPSTSAQIVRKTIFEQSAKRFIANECSFQYRQVIKYDAHFQRKQSRIELTLVGEPLPTDSINLLTTKLPAYGLADAELVVRQGTFKDARVDVDAITNSVTEQVFRYNQASVRSKIKPSTRYVGTLNLTRLHNFRWPIYGMS